MMEEILRKQQKPHSLKMHHQECPLANSNIKKIILSKVQINRLNALAKASNRPQIDRMPYCNHYKINHYEPYK